LTSLAAIPGVRSAAMSSGAPFGNGSYTTTPIATQGQSPLPPETAVPTDWRIVSPAYFKTMQIPILRGRDFAEAEMTPAAMVVIVSQATARRFWGDTDPIGRTLHRQGDLQRQYTVIGVVGDVRQTALNQDRASIYYASSLVGIWPAMDIALRTEGDPSSVLGTVRQRVRDLDPNLPLSSVRTMDEWVYASSAPSRLNAVLMAAFAAVALVLGAIGIHGVLAYSVTQRTQEIGVRMALGAEPASVVGLIVRDGLRVGIPGVAAGLAVALGLSRFLDSLVYGVTVRDPLTYGGVAGVLALIALAACVVPARTASRVDPLVALRQD
jgi:predicted permease